MIVRSPAFSANKAVVSAGFLLNAVSAINLPRLRNSSFFGYESVSQFKAINTASFLSSEVLMNTDPSSRLYQND